MKSPFPNSYWLEPDKILCGEYPRDLDDHGDHSSLKALLQAGVRTFIDLTREGELKSYRETAYQFAGELGIDPSELEFYRFPISDGSIPNSREEMLAILEQVAQARNEDRMVYIHCYGGKGRTGTVAGCVLSEINRCDGADALKMLGERWKGCAKSAHSSSPETDQQCGFIRKWEPSGTLFSD
ncbi:MAG: tyrosine-protein phosphatase [Verrucomicrobiales bacterium]|nr:tyrosine-protein phosphatase [Verrucomicrobiales bacterium]